MLCRNELCINHIKPTADNVTSLRRLFYKKEKNKYLDNVVVPVVRKTRRLRETQNILSWFTK